MPQFLALSVAAAASSGRCGRLSLLEAATAPTLSGISAAAVGRVCLAACGPAAASIYGLSDADARNSSTPRLFRVDATVVLLVYCFVRGPTYRRSIVTAI